MNTSKILILSLVLLYMQCGCTNQETARPLSVQMKDSFRARYYQQKMEVKLELQEKTFDKIKFSLNTTRGNDFKEYTPLSSDDFLITVCTLKEGKITQFTAVPDLGPGVVPERGGISLKGRLAYSAKINNGELVDILVKYKGMTLE